MWQSSEKAPHGSARNFQRGPTALAPNTMGHNDVLLGTRARDPYVTPPLAFVAAQYVGNTPCNPCGTAYAYK